MSQWAVDVTVFETIIERLASRARNDDELDSVLALTQLAAMLRTAIDELGNNGQPDTGRLLTTLDEALERLP